MTAPTPADYIRSLQRDRPKPSMTVAEVKRALARFESPPEREITQAVRAFNKSDYAQRLLDDIRGRFAPNVLAVIDSGRIAVGEIESDEIGAYSVPLATGHAVVLQSATHRFIYRIARILSTRFVVTGSDHHSMPIEVTARIMAEAFWWYQETGRAFGPDYPVTAGQLHMANLLTYETMSFLLCHEIAHALADQHGGAAYLAEAKAAPHLDEHGADALGALLALGIGAPGGLRPNDDMALSYAGIEFALQIYAVLEDLGVTFADSHPGARARLRLIKDVIAERCGGDSWRVLTSLSAGIEHVFGTIARVIADPGEHAAFFEREAQSVAAALDALLDACATVPVPNYARFYQEAGELVERGYTHRLLARIAEVTAQFHQALEETPTMARQERIKRFQKFKLLVGWIDQWLNEPARTLFRAALEAGRS